MNAGLLGRYGLLDRFERLPKGELYQFTISPVDAGPDGGTGRGGCIVALGGVPSVYAPGTQTWAEAMGANGETFWAGLDADWPQPEDLCRERIITGHHALLADGKQWRVPMLHQWDVAACRHVPNLPTTFRPKPGMLGQPPERLVMPAYTHADEMGKQIFDAFMAQRTLRADEAFDLAVRLLAFNYRLGAVEAGMLGIFDETAIRRVLGLAIDEPRMDDGAQAWAERGVESSGHVIDDGDEE